MKMKIAVVGDMFFGGEFQNTGVSASRDLNFYFKDIKNVFEKSDIILGNLECCLMENNRLRKKDWLLHCNNKQADILSYLSFDALSVANNHMGDLDEEGIEHTLRELRNRNISYTGAGSDSVSALRWVNIKCGNGLVAFGAYCDPGIPGAVCATESNAGAASFDFDTVISAIKLNKKLSDVVVVSVHWGEQFFDYPTPKQVTQARAMIDAGASIIMGHHPHVLQGYERYNDGVIFYSLGNFFMPDFRLQNNDIYRYPQKSKLFAIGMVDFEHGKVVNVENIYGYMLKDFSLSVCKQPLSAALCNHINQLSEPMLQEDYLGYWERYEPIGISFAFDDEKNFYRRNFYRRVLRRRFSDNLSLVFNKIKSLI